jgi:5S rRNA maturation endonuclease (ribonuclease M5)
LISSQQISSISDKLLDSLGDILDHFEIEYRESPSRYFFPCPIHNGDNADGCTIYRNSGVWNCHTASCQDKYKKTIIGFIRGVLSNRAGKEVSFTDTLKYTSRFTGSGIHHDVEMEVFKEREGVKKNNKIFSIFMQDVRESNSIISPTIKIEDLRVPSPYYINRGFSPDILNKFGVGECYERGNPMFNRCVVPIYDKEKKYIGCTGRATSEDFKPKWINSEGFLKNNYLYGLDLAYPSIVESGKLFLVEGPGDLWRMHEAGYNNTVAIFGAAMSEQQALILESLPIFDLIISTDSDLAGENAAKKIMKQCGRRYNYHRLLTGNKDVGGTEVNKLQEIVEKLWAKF